MRVGEHAQPRRRLSKGGNHVHHRPPRHHSNSRPGARKAWYRKPVAWVAAFLLAAGLAAGLVFGVFARERAVGRAQAGSSPEPGRT